MSERSFANIVTSNKDHLFIGRQKELGLFAEYVGYRRDAAVILNIHGLGGIGKSSLLDQFERIAVGQGAAFFKMDSNDFDHSIPHFLRFVAQLLDLEMKSDSQAAILQLTMKKLRELARRQKVVLAIDTYEQMHALDRWLRESFFRRLPQNVLLVISGRTPLLELWRPYPHWCEIVRPIPLDLFSLADVKQYAELHDLHDSQVHQQLYTLTRGHPLTLALVLETKTRETAQVALDTYLVNNLDHIVVRWLREIRREKIRQMIAAAAIVRSFNQELLEHLIGETISAADFYELIDVSFMRRTHTGWMVHSLLQSHLAREIRLRTPSEYKLLWERSISYYYERLHNLSPGESQSKWMKDLFFVLGGSLVQMAFFQEQTENRFFAEAADETNYPEIKQFLDDLIERFKQLHVQYLDAASRQQYVHDMPVTYFQREAELLANEALLSLGMDAFHLIRNEFGELTGLIVNVPINDQTMGYLCQSPVSAGYSSQLSEQERAAYALPAPGRSGCFLRLIGFKDDNDLSARTALMYHLLSLWLQEPRSIVTTAFPFYIQLLERIGFEQVPNLVHFHYGDQFPAPTFILDLREERLSQFLRRIVETAGVSVGSHLAAGAFDLTPREREVTRLVMEGLSNAEIAERLSLAEITIKKHLSSIYQKTDVKNRRELMAKIYASM